MPTPEEPVPKSLCGQWHNARIRASSSCKYLCLQAPPPPAPSQGSLCVVPYGSVGPSRLLTTAGSYTSASQNLESLSPATPSLGCWGNRDSTEASVNHQSKHRLQCVTHSRPSAQQAYLEELSVLCQPLGYINMKET